MSKYLCVGLAKEIVVHVRDKEMGEEVEKDFFKKVEKNLYDVTFKENDGSDRSYVIFNLKEELMAKYSMDLMIEQHEKFIKSIYSEEAIEYFKDIKNKSIKQIIEIINTASSTNMQMLKMGGFGFDISYLFDIRVAAYITEFVIFHCSQKTFMEEYKIFFNYMRNLLINSTDNPLKTAIAISL